MPRPPASRLPLHLAGAYTLLAVYGSLYPFSGWTDTGTPLTAFLTAGWPRYTTTFDVVINVAAYVPLGFLWLAALRRPLGRGLALVVALLVGTLLSLALETVQNFLPSRIPSNLDLGCNAVGTLIGAAAGSLSRGRLFDSGRLRAYRYRLFESGAMADLGLLLILLWLLTQFNVETLLFGNGDLRRLLDLPTLPYVADKFPRIEALIVGANTVAATLLISLLARRRLPALMAVAAALAAKSFAFLLMMKGSDALAWATLGSLSGLAVGMVLWFFASALPMRWRQSIATLALLLAAIVVNLAPENPYLANTMQDWNPGQFLHFHGLTHLVSNLWPFLALPWLVFMREEP